MPKRVLHVGLPKTGSSAFQYILQRNNELLLRHDVWCPPLHLVRDKLTYRFVYRGELGFDIEPFLARPNVLISEEDILGKYFYFEEGRIFPHLERNMKRFSDLMNWEKFDVWIVLREYSDWLESCYLQWFKVPDREVISFSEYCDSLDPSSLSWAVLLRRIKALDCVGSIHVFLYEDFRANNDVLFDTVRDVFKVPPLQRDQNVSRNTSLSEDGYKLIMATKGVDSESARRVREFVLREFRNSGARKPCVMTSLEKGLLKDKYVKDILAISEEFDADAKVKVCTICK